MKDRRRELATLPIHVRVLWAAYVRHRLHDSWIGAALDHGALRNRQSRSGLTPSADVFWDTRSLPRLWPASRSLRLQRNSSGGDSDGCPRTRVDRVRVVAE